MKNIIIILWALFTFILVSCSGEDSKVEIAELNHQIDSLKEVIIQCELRIEQNAERALEQAEIAREAAMEAAEKEE